MDEKKYLEYKHMADLTEIEMLQGRLAQCLDKMDCDQIATEVMAINHPEVSFEFMESGEYRGPEHVRQYLNELRGDLKKMCSQRGFLALQGLNSPVIFFNADGTRSKGQWNILAACAGETVMNQEMQKRLTAYWFLGKYNNEFIFENGEWKVLKVQLISWIRTPYDQGWFRNPDAFRLIPHQGIQPDRPPVYHTYHPEASYSADGVYNFGPQLLLGDDEFIY